MPIPNDEPSLRQLLLVVSEQLGTLWNQLFMLARAEARLASRSLIASLAGMAGGLIIAATGLAVLLSALVLVAIALGLAPWIAALLVGTLLVGAGAALAYVAFRKLRRASLTLEQTRESVKETLAWLKTETSR
jgi:protein-S-isoprenylcysteine O-methyltransferase Ste14